MIIIVSIIMTRGSSRNTLEYNNIKTINVKNANFNAVDKSEFSFEILSYLISFAFVLWCITDLKNNKIIKQ